MLSQTILRALQIYGIAIVISMIVAVMIKVLVTLTGRINRPRVATAVTSVAPQPAPVASPGVPADVVAAISAALAVITGPHRILHIAESKRSWARQGRDAQHSHQPSRH